MAGTSFAARCVRCDNEWISLSQHSTCPDCMTPWRLPKAERLGSNDTRDLFKAGRPANTQTCARCMGQASTWHHWLPQAAIRTYVAALGLDRPQARTLLRRLLADLRNISPYCFDCHQAGEARAGRKRFRRREVPPSAWGFARELDEAMVARLERAYPD